MSALSSHYLHLWGVFWQKLKPVQRSLYFKGDPTYNTKITLVQPPPGMSAPQSKNAVSTNIKHSRYIHLMSNFSSIHFHAKRLYVHMFDIVDTPFSYGRGLITCYSLQEFSKTKESTKCDPKCRYCSFTLWGKVPVLYLNQLVMSLGSFSHEWIV